MNIYARVPRVSSPMPWTVLAHMPSSPKNEASDVWCMNLAVCRINDGKAQQDMALEAGSLNLALTLHL